MEIIQIVPVVADLVIDLRDFMNNTMYYAFQPYIAIFGNFFFGIFFGFIGTGIYVASERNYLLTFGYLVLMGIFFGIIMPFAFVAILGVIAAFIGSMIVYKAFVETRS